jgi:hypothetical protein
MAEMDPYIRGYEDGRRETIDFIERSRPMQKAKEYSYHGQGYYHAQQDMKEVLKCVPHKAAREPVKGPDRDSLREGDIELQTIKWRIAKVLKDRGYSAMMVADMLGCSFTVAGNYLNSKNCPSAEKIAKICRELDISADVILGLK